MYHCESRMLIKPKLYEQSSPPTPSSPKKISCILSSHEFHPLLPVLTHFTDAGYLWESEAELFQAKNAAGTNEGVSWFAPKVYWIIGRNYVIISVI